MNGSTLILVILFAIASVSARSYHEKEARVLEEITAEMENLHGKEIGLIGQLTSEIGNIRKHHVAKSRGRRGVKVCGRHLMLFTLNVCGELGSDSTNVDVATKCCEGQCTEQFIKSSVCPSKAK